MVHSVTNTQGKNQVTYRIGVLNEIMSSWNHVLVQV